MNKLGNSSHRPNRVPFSVGDKEESRAASRSGKHLSSTVTSGLDSGHVTDNKKVKGDKSKSTIWHSEDVRSCKHHGETDGAKGGNTTHPSHAHCSRKEERKSSQDRVSRGGSSSRSHSKDKVDYWKCVNPQCKNFNFIGSFKCMRCGLPRKISNSIGPKLYNKK